MASGYHRFPGKGAVNETKEHGVYLIYDPSNNILHVGKTNRAKNGLNQRLQNHISGNSSFSIQFLKMDGGVLRKGYKFKYLVVTHSRKRALLEALATGVLCPAHIGTGEKKK